MLKPINALLFDFFCTPSSTQHCDPAVLFSFANPRKNTNENKRVYSIKNPRACQLPPSYQVHTNPTHFSHAPF